MKNDHSSKYCCFCVIKPDSLIVADYSDNQQKGNHMTKIRIILAIILGVLITSTAALPSVAEQMVEDELQSSTQVVSNAPSNQLYVNTPSGSVYVSPIYANGYLYLNNNGVITGHSLSLSWPTAGDCYISSSYVTNYGNRVVVTCNVATNNSSYSLSANTLYITIYSNAISYNYEETE
ncbi:MAG: hypothetical protein IKD71_02050 [Solobacterium sp.]|nr:hypothetical protein [Solobacterium sp.]